MDWISSSTANSQIGLEKNNFHKVKGERFMIYCNCPIADVKISRYKSAIFTVLGDSGQECDMNIVSESKLKHSNFTVSQLLGKDEVILKDVKSTDLMMEYKINANATIKIKWN